MPEILIFKYVAINSIQKKRQPAFLQLTYYRYLEHVGIHEDFHAGYRDKKEFLKWQKRDPVKLLKHKLKRLNVPESDIAKLEKSIDKQVEEGFQWAVNASFPDPSELLKNTLYEQTT